MPSSALSIRRHPGPELFPYPTLFRSATDRPPMPSRRRCLTTGDVESLVRDRTVVAHHGPPRVGLELEWLTLFPHEPDRRVTPADLQPDRKSTRLNSSHQIIAYAVFCFKHTAPPGS